MQLSAPTEQATSRNLGVLIESDIYLEGAAVDSAVGMQVSHMWFSQSLVMIKPEDDEWVSVLVVVLCSSCSERPPRKPDLRWIASTSKHQDMLSFFSHLYRLWFDSYSQEFLPTFWLNNKAAFFTLLIVLTFFCGAFVAAEWINGFPSKTIRSFCFSCYFCWVETCNHAGVFLTALNVESMTESLLCARCKCWIFNSMKSNNIIFNIF